jgi:cytochrome b6-f complex iron-sulfur subunit
MSEAPQKPARGNIAAAKAAAAAAGIVSEPVPSKHAPTAPAKKPETPAPAPAAAAPAAVEATPPAPAAATPAAGGAGKPARGNIAAAMAAAMAAGISTKVAPPKAGHSAPAAAAAPKPAAAAASAPAAPAPAAKPAEHKPAPAAAKTETKTEAKPAAKTPAAPAPKLTPRPAPKPAAPTRRDFNAALAIGWGSFAAACAVSLNATVRFLYPNLLPEKPQEFKAGRKDEFPEGVDGRFKENQGVWLIRTPEEIYALSVICTHLGCIPNWLESDQKFKCPCHGSGFYKSGINFEGPAPRPMERFAIREENGQVVVDKRRKFQEELGQWKDPDSFITL